ncbi:hypothetical protein SAMN05216275_110237 [Streptosporangium canum]|uniref:Transposase n=1 Tax=Streptosporangium canum TaxID=324952 RepID=A0A1I3SYT5_9ACTN|nr:hypothetical protein SAMN05216275_110237 [Streptosporangium canum]
MARKSPYSPELRQRAIRMVREVRPQYDNEMARRSGRCHQMQSRASALVRGPGRRVVAGAVTAADNRGGAVAESWRSGVLGC